MDKITNYELQLPACRPACRRDRTGAGRDCEFWEESKQPIIFNIYQEPNYEQ
jgi:hypothetical protein